MLPSAPLTIISLFTPFKISLDSAILYKVTYPIGVNTG